MDALRATIVFEPEYRNPDALRGIDSYSHLWLIWEFSEANMPAGKWQPTVRPPRLGGNKRVGVFATRSPFRPNSLGLSCVKLESFVPETENGPVLVVTGADLMNGTPIYDIKPYLPQFDCVENALGGFTETIDKKPLNISFPAELLSKIPKEKHGSIIKLLSNDPRPSYQNDNDRVYGFRFADYEIKFTVENNIDLTVVAVEKI